MECIGAQIIHTLYQGTCCATGEGLREGWVHHQMCFEGSRQCLKHLVNTMFKLCSFGTN